MTLGAAVLFLMLLAAALSPIFLVYQVTQLAHSVFRNKLWLIRDRLVDDIRLGRIERSSGAEALLELVQMHIDVAGRHTLVDSLIGLALYRSNDAKSLPEEILGRDLSDADMARLNGYLCELRDASLAHLSWASPTGWVVVPLVRVIGRMARVKTERQSESGGRAAKESTLQRKAERVELQVMPKLVPRRAPQIDVEATAVLTHVPC